jgi:two-component system, cell cycle sensor histidine kinase and response regulator CckA
MQAIGQLAGGVAHDFNNLLTAISGHCDLLLKRHPGHPDYADLEQINQNANRAASLVSQLLAFSRKQTLQPDSFSTCATRWPISPIS